MKLLVLSIVFLVLIISCNNKSDNNGIILQSMKDKILNIETIDDLFTVKEISLKTKNKVSIGKIGAVTVDVAGNIYIVGGSKELYKFDSFGNFIKKLRKIGHGPGEYNKFDTFFVDEYQNIYIDQAPKRAIFVYDKSFNFSYIIKKESLYPLIQIAKYKDYLIGFTPTRKNATIFLYNTKTKSQVDEMGIENEDRKKFGINIFGGNIDILGEKIYFVFPEQYQIFVVKDKKTTKLLKAKPSYFKTPDKKLISMRDISSKRSSVIYSVSVEKEFIMLSYTDSFFGKNGGVFFDIFNLNGQIIKTQVPTRLKRNFIKYAPGKYIAYKTFDSIEEEFTVKVYLFELKE